MNGKLLRQVLDKYMKSPVAQEARVQVVLPNGEFYDINGIQLLENKLLATMEMTEICNNLRQIDAIKNNGLIMQACAIGRFIVEVVQPKIGSRSDVALVSR